MIELTANDKAGVTSEVTAEVDRLTADEAAQAGKRWARHQAITRLLRACESVAVDDLLEGREQWPPRLEKIRQLRDMQTAEFSRLMEAHRPA